MTERAGGSGEMPLSGPEGPSGLSGPLLDLPFDHFERYAFTRRALELLARDGRKLRILDVGGHSSPVKRFLPQHTVVLADPLPPGSFSGLPLACDAYVQASGTQLPFVDRSFDVVGAHDTLEHVPGAWREGLVQELLRVGRSVVILNGPVHQPGIERAEEGLTRFSEALGLGSNRSLEEHVLNGLPRRAEIEGWLRRAGCAFVTVPNGNLALWAAGQATRLLAASMSDPVQMVAALDRAYNRLLALLDLGGLCYREAFVIALDGGTRGVLDALGGLGHAAPASVEDVLGQLRSLLSDLERRAGEARIRATDREAPLARERAAVTELRDALRDQQLRLDRITAGTAYRLLLRLGRVVDRLAPWGTRRRSLVLAPMRAARFVLSHGWRAFLKRLPAFWRWLPGLWKTALPNPDHLTRDEAYELWLRLEVLSPNRIRAMRREARRLTYRPTVSVVLPVDRAEREPLTRAVNSVRGQLYGEWELCIAADGSLPSDLRSMLRAVGRRDPRVKVTLLDGRPSTVALVRAALASATGEFVGFLGDHDELKPNAVFEVAQCLNEQRHVDLVYSDEDARDVNGRLVNPILKPDWSPVLLLSVNYVGRWAVYRKRIAEAVGGLREEFEGAEAQDYDLALRVSEKAEGIAHVALPLYTSGGPGAPGSPAAGTHEAGRRALEGALARRGLRGRVEEGLVGDRYRVRHEIQGDPRVLIIIPTRDRADLLRRCIASIRERSTYRNYEIMVVDNESREPETLALLSGFEGRVLRYPHPFNYSEMMNLAVRDAGETDFVLFLNNDTEVLSRQWIEALVEQGQRKDVAAVGARLLFRDGTPQHEGVIIGLGGAPAANVDHGGYFRLGETVRDCSAVSAACMLVRPEVYWEFGGFEERLGVAYNDIDFCLRAREKGYLIVYTPYALLYHDEGSTRGRGVQPVENEVLFRQRWGEPGTYRDPYYNPNFDLRRPFTIRVPAG